MHLEMYCLKVVATHKAFCFLREVDHIVNCVQFLKLEIHAQVKHNSGDTVFKVTKESL